ncbi:MAG: hypothetical protein O3A00_16695 [Planctomycetota bacterium]|nr:hypothetical protein [Planctomycetota bacterium]
MLLVIGASAIAVSYQQAKSARANAELKEKSDESLVYLLQLSNLMYTNGLPSEALEKMEQLLFVARDKYQDKPSDQAQVFLCEVLNGVGVTQHKSGQIDEAMATFGELDELLSHVITESNGRLNLKWLQLIVAMRSNYGMTLRTHALRNGQSLDHAVGNYERAIPFCERVIAETNDSPDS